MVTGQAVYQWERGVVFPSTDNLFRLAALFGITMSDIIVAIKPDNSIYDRNRDRITLKESTFRSSEFLLDSSSHSRGCTIPPHQLIEIRNILIAEKLRSNNMDQSYPETLFQR